MSDVVIHEFDELKIGKELFVSLNKTKEQFIKLIVEDIVLDEKNLNPSNLRLISRIELDSQLNACDVICFAYLGSNGLNLNSIGDRIQSVPVMASNRSRFRNLGVKITVKAEKPKGTTYIIVRIRILPEQATTAEDE